MPGCRIGPFYIGQPSREQQEEVVQQVPRYGIYNATAAADVGAVVLWASHDSTGCLIAIM